MNGVLEYLQERVAKLGLIQPDRSNLFVALDEAFVNAVKHGNKNDPTKLLRITAELSPQEASFTVEDEGEGFDIGEIPDPCDPANLFRTSGRGVLLIYNIMDEVEYNAQGNRVKMVKRPDGRSDTQLVDPNIPDDKHALTVFSSSNPVHFLACLAMVVTTGINRARPRSLFRRSIYR